MDGSVQRPVWVVLTAHLSKLCPEHISVKLAKTIRLDISDQNTFALAAEPGEWAVAGTFAFADMDPASMDNKQQLAFRNGWLGLSSFGRASLVQVVSVNDQEFEDAVRALAGHLHQHYGAPDMLAALNAARVEVLDARDICDHPPGTLLSIERELTDDGIAERINVISQNNDDLHARIWAIEADDPV